MDGILTVLFLSLIITGQATAGESKGILVVRFINKEVQADANINEVFTKSFITLYWQSTGFDKNIVIGLATDFR